MVSTKDETLDEIVVNDTKLIEVSYIVELQHDDTIRSLPSRIPMSDIVANVDIKDLFKYVRII